VRQEAGDRIVPVAADVRSRGDARRVIDLATSKGRRIDVLVNNAGVMLTKPFLETSDEEWRDTLATNLDGVFMLSQEVVRRMLEDGGGGAIVNVASTDSSVAESPLAAYDVFKAALLQLTRCIAVEFGHVGIRCNAICPGLTETPLTTPEWSSEFSAAYTRRIPMRRAAAPEEQAAVILFLASGAASFVNGAALVADGGELAGFCYSPEPSSGPGTGG
jgi:NAD(P)-dependent dehydrogenase (short-subunit alcohol dehydrogenase family)